MARDDPQQQPQGPQLLPPGIDETLIVEQLRLSHDQRLAQLESMYQWTRELAIAGARARGELA